ncbi:hypothetical protein B7494_g354 [Chlorociboria aeruginascens]|nr:hypothetical protein B7494_g354 [Chlorociboria aeruginascens]
MKCCKVTPETKSPRAQSKAQKDFTQAIEEIKKLQPRLCKDAASRLGDLTTAMKCLIEESVKSYIYFTTAPNLRPGTTGKFETRLRAKGQNVQDIFWDLRKMHPLFKRSHVRNQVDLKCKGFVNPTQWQSNGLLNAPSTTCQNRSRPSRNHTSSSQPLGNKSRPTNPTQSSSDPSMDLNDKLQNIFALTRALQFQQHESISGFQNQERSSNGEILAHFALDRQFLAIANAEQETNSSLLKLGRLLIEGSVDIEGGPKLEHILSTVDLIMQQIKDFVDEIMIPDPQKALDNNEVESGGQKAIR